ncbi:hypothetical protein GCM10020255_078040 [Rhodococcus baikonurensis]
MGVNRLTIRQAIGELARAGHVIVRQGAGTYIAEPPVVIELVLPAMPSTDADAGSTTSFRRTRRHDQTETLVKITDFDTDRDAAEALGVPGPSSRSSPWYGRAASRSWCADIGSRPVGFRTSPL